jgi:cysteine desulfurase
MMGELTDGYYNPSSVYRDGRAVRAAVEEARAVIAGAVGAEPAALVFTSGGTEANNFALKGAAFARGSGHIVTTAAEHHSVLFCCEWLSRRGFSLTVLEVDAQGRVSPEAVANAMRPDTFLVSCMWVNNETGAINPVRELAAAAHEGGALFHTDAVQALPTEEIDVRAAGIDMLSISAHKIYGPKGCGALYIRDGIALEPLLHGGRQESMRRGGTEAVPAILGFKKAAELLGAQRSARRNHARILREALLRSLADIPGVRVNSPPDGAPSSLNVGFAGVQAEALVLLLDRSGIRVSMGAACNSDSLEPSHVLTAMRVPEEYLHGSIRFSFGQYNTLAEIAEAAEAVKRIVALQRSR